MKKGASSDGNNRTNSIHASLRQLLALGLSKSSSAEPQKITRTVKIKIQRKKELELYETDPELHQTLTRHFNAVQKFRQSVLDELETWWNKKPDDFTSMVRASAKERFEKKSRCYGWLSTRFVSGKELPPELTPGFARSVLLSLEGGLKSFLTRRGNVAKDLQEAYLANGKLWNEKIARIIRDHKDKLKGQTPPTAPPTINFEKLTAGQVEKYNVWVGQARMWGNLILHQQLVQKGLVDREDAKLPRRLKGYPGFPGSQRYLQGAAFVDSLAELDKIAKKLAKDSEKRFAKISDEHWSKILERFFPPENTNGETHRRPRTVKQMAAERLHYLCKQNPDWKPEQIAKEVLAGLFRLADKLQAHLKHNSPNDRRAVIKLANVLNIAAVFSLEPLRASGDYVACFAADEPRRQAFADLRGALTQPGDDTAAIEIAGFSLSSNSPQYCGLLACRELKPDSDEWAFFYALGNQDVKIFTKAPAKPPKNWQPSAWRGFATEGSDDEKQIVRGSVWLPVENSKVKPALALPLAFGSRQGREYFWHFDRDLRTRDEWTPLNTRLLRVMPAAQKNESRIETALRANRAEFYVTITFQRLAPPVADLKPKELIGVDRGEVVPAVFAIVDVKGRFLVKPERLRQFHQYLATIEQWESKEKKWRDEFLPSFYEALSKQPKKARRTLLKRTEHLSILCRYLENQRMKLRFLDHWITQALPVLQELIDSKPVWALQLDDSFGFIAPEYRDQQREFNNKKRELQRTKGGYTRWLRAKERNKARALGGQATRELLSLATTRSAPLIFESLDSNFAARGGRDTMMSQMQYTRVFAGVEQKLAEAGLCQLASQPKFRKHDNGFLKLIEPHWTSLTCSVCGHVHSSDFYRQLKPIPIGADGTVWEVTLPDGQKRTLPGQFEYWIRGQGKKMGSTHERISKLLNKPFEQLSDTNRNALASAMRSYWLSVRPVQSKFKCVVCLNEMNADLQAALNIARKYLFEQDYPTKKGERDRRAKWAKWYKEKIATVWHK